MKLLRYELKKLFSSKGILFLVTVLLLVNAVLCYLSPSGVDKKRSDEEYVASYRSDIERVIRLAERNIADLSGGGDSFPEWHGNDGSVPPALPCCNTA